jgi:hypothetical protein
MFKRMARRCWPSVTINSGYTASGIGLVYIYFNPEDKMWSLGTTERYLKD